MSHEVTSNQQLTSIVSRARTLAGQNEYPVGIRELFLALLSGDPHGVIRSWQAQDLDGARLIEAVKEWWPAVETRGVLPGAAQFTDEAGAALNWVTEQTSGVKSAPEALLHHLLDARVCSLAGTGAGGTTEASADRTAIVLSSMGLV